MERWWRPALAELIGTFALVFIGAGSIIVDAFTDGKVGLVGIALAHGLTLAVVVSAVGHISGGHINPAVTLGFMVVKRIGIGLGLIYMVAQLVGAALAGFILAALYPGDAAAKVHLGATALASGIDPGTGTIIELILAFFLVFAVFGTAVDPRGPKSIAGFGIGLALAYGFWENFPVYVIGPALGGIIAALIYEHLLRE